MAEEKTTSIAANNHHVSFTAHERDAEHQLEYLLVVCLSEMM